MKGFWARVAGVVLIAVIAFGMVAPSLQAGLTVSGKFKLPFDARWGREVLPAGDYSFTVNGFSMNGRIFVRRGTQTVEILVPQMFEENDKQAMNPVLLGIRHDGNVTIRALRLPKVGTFYFSLPKELSVLVAQQPQLIETVSVEVSGD